MAETVNTSTGTRWSLKGMTALVTGGTRGIGHAIVEELAGFGATVHTCSRNEAELNRCIKEWEGKGLVVSGSVCDLSARPERENLMENVAKLFNGKLNILVMIRGRILLKRGNDENQQAALKNPLHVSVWPITRVRSKKIKEALNELIQEIWADSKAEHSNFDLKEDEHAINLIQASDGVGLA